MVASSGPGGTGRGDGVWGGGGDDGGGFGGWEGGRRHGRRWPPLWVATPPPFPPHPRGGDGHRCRHQRRRRWHLPQAVCWAPPGGRVRDGGDGTNCWAAPLGEGGGWTGSTSRWGAPAMGTAAGGAHALSGCLVTVRVPVSSPDQRRRVSTASTGSPPAFGAARGVGGLRVGLEHRGFSRGGDCGRGGSGGGGGGDGGGWRPPWSPTPGSLSGRGRRIAHTSMRLASAAVAVTAMAVKEMTALGGGGGDRALGAPRCQRHRRPFAPRAAAAAAEVGGRSAATCRRWAMVVASRVGRPVLLDGSRGPGGGAHLLASRPWGSSSTGGGGGRGSGGRRRTGRLGRE